MEEEADALGQLKRYEEALVIAQYCVKTRTDHPERFSDGGKVPGSCFFTMAQLLQRVGRLEEAEAMLKQVMDMLKIDGKEVSPQMAASIAASVGLYRLQGREKEAAAMVKAVRKLAPQVFPKDHPNYKKYMEL
jgi:tetratricopeptide (TPR) repeat protein